MPRRNRSRRPVSSRRRRGPLEYTYYSVGVILSPSTISLTATSVPSGRSYKPLRGWIKITALGGPAVIQLELINQAKVTIKTLPPVLTNSVTVQQHFRYPRSDDWHSSPSDVILNMNAVCLVKGETRTIYYESFFVFQLSNREIPEACPALAAMLADLSLEPSASSSLGFESL